MNDSRRLLWTSAAESHIGMVRKINEDAFLTLPERGLWGVADGMGGHEAGDVASRMIIDTLRQIPPSSDWQTQVAKVKESLWTVNRRLRQESTRRYQRRTIGSTVAALLAFEDQCACLWVGDSRIYRLRDGQLRQLTRDHSHVQELIEHGLISPEEAPNHPMSNMITRAVGSDDHLDIDLVTLSLRPDDVYLICTDGLNRMLSDPEIAHILDYPDNEEIVKTLIQLSLIRGANDNVTVVVVRIGGDGPINPES